MTIKEDVFADLLDRIIRNQLPPGHRINEKELMAQYGIGRTPLREVFIELQKDKFIEIIPKVGTRVTQVDLHRIKELVYIRRELEGMVGELAARHITPFQLDRLKDILKTVEGFNPSDQDRLDCKKILSQCDMDFHHLLYDVCQNLSLRQMILKIQNQMMRFWFHINFFKEESLVELIELRQIIPAFENRDGDTARNIMRNHVDYLTNRIRNHLF